MTKTEQEARELGRKAGDRSMKAGGRTRWNEDDAAAAIVAYRKAAGKPDATIQAAKAALADLTGAKGKRNHKPALNRSKRK